ncbi:ABC transporter permease [Methylovirgula sp. 4M-Z18]|uniref:ABC transporter permease n=1 Tax=Methylovirgula sp. 4M-Z18 TaxID=2293567 RepID=UPI000E2ED68B|nr:ABC transporter permease [Methylovirgula sp. 4M-Z18]RFB81348.1 ABC transporter permease [Methylovirgula sp. 4M-Z18]
MSFHFLAFILGNAVTFSIPLLCACLGGLWSERAGVVDIGLEGKLLAAAFASVLGAYMSGNAWVGLFSGIFVAMFFSLVHGFATISQRGNQIIAGVAINFVAAGLTALVGNAEFSQGGRTPELDAAARFVPLTWPGADALQNVPVLGDLYKNVISGHDPTTYIALLAVPVTAFVLYHSRFGLRLRAVGENPAAVDTAGISVTRLRYGATLICGLLCGIGGTNLAMALSSSFEPMMSANRGYMALAALVFAKWRPYPALATCMLFGLLEAASIPLQNAQVPGLTQDQVQAMTQAMPYVLTVILLAGFIGRAIPPKASGVPYVKER